MDPKGLLRILAPVLVILIFFFLASPSSEPDIDMPDVPDDASENLFEPYDGLRITNWSAVDGVSFSYDTGALQGLASLAPSYQWLELDYDPEQLNYKFCFENGRHSLTVQWDRDQETPPDRFELHEIHNLWALVMDDTPLYPTYVPMPRAEDYMSEETSYGTVSLLLCFEPLYDVSIYLVPDAGSEIFYPDTEPELLAHYDVYRPEEPFPWIIDEHVYMHLSIQCTDADGRVFLQQYSVSGRKYPGGISRPLDAPDW